MPSRDPQLRAIDHDIRGLAVPALGALMAEPLFLLADSAMVGHLGSTQLAGLAVASTLLQTAVGLMIFLAYATTPSVARRVGAGDRTGALTAGASGMWLALLIGVVLSLAALPAARPIIGWFSSDAGVAAEAATYLRVSLAGIPAMLLVLAGTGVLRGLQDTRTTLVVSGAGFLANIALNAILIYGLRMGIAGSALGTVIAQWAMAAAYVAIVVRAARGSGASLMPDPALIGGVATSSWWLFVRTVGLRIGVVATVWVAARLGPAETAGYQVLSTVFSAFAFGLDALAIAAQALLARAIGAGDREAVTTTTRRLITWGWRCGAAGALVIAAASPVLGRVFTSDPTVLGPLPWTFLLMASGLPLAGYVFVLDGILIAAEDYPYLAIASVATIAVLLPVLLGVAATGTTGVAGMLLIWASYGFVFIGMRAVMLTLRIRGTTWLRA
ncbi:MATE family efflux transporter [Brooklawnia cerclae]|uniref:MATE family efflux protein n=1 Tax=Brooklawnia cerclae TaxID=349934 RepID=A0ABX0SM40_9ACTN|nr:putative MATE family efflux protein [Brooklawnia cerclae]